MLDTITSKLWYYQTIENWMNKKYFFEIFQIHIYVYIHIYMYVYTYISIWFIILINRGVANQPKNTQKL